MINAKEAQRKTLLATKAKKMMEKIEKAILYAIDRRGESETNIEVSGVADEEIVKDVIIPELISLGYKAEFIPAEPKPAQCPSDQWFSYAYLHISWGV